MTVTIHVINVKLFFVICLPISTAPRSSKKLPSMQACRNVRTLAPNAVPNELATSLAPMAKERTKAMMKPTTIIHRTSSYAKNDILRQVLWRKQLLKDYLSKFIWKSIHRGDCAFLGENMDKCRIIVNIKVKLKYTKRPGGPLAWGRTNILETTIDSTFRVLLQSKFQNLHVNAKVNQNVDVRQMDSRTININQ